MHFGWLHEVLFVMRRMRRAEPVALGRVRVKAAMSSVIFNAEVGCQQA